MSEIVLLVRLNWDRTAMPGLCPRGFYTTHVTPTDEHPFGQRGLVMASAWKSLSSPGMAGVVFLDGDVAIDPVDLAAMMAAIEGDPKAIHVAPVRLWPVSTKASGWVWGHGRDNTFSREDWDEPDSYGFGFTYLPRRLMAACITAGMESWRYPGVDSKVSAQSRRLKIPVSVVRGASAKHLNF